MNVHADIPAFPASVRTEFLYDMDPMFEGKTEPCTVFAVSSYKGHYPTFKILLRNGSLFDYIPAHALTIAPRNQDVLGLEELVYSKSCPDFNITVNVHAHLVQETEKGCVCYIPNKKEWRVVDRYICTIDWFTDNHNAHLVALSNGQFAFVPNHKLLLTQKTLAECEFPSPSYKKLRQEWKP
jgi:hypothetical protein